jgi:hypothetical protein
MHSKVAIFVLILIPFFMMIVALPFVNRIYPIVFGLPFLQFWLFLSMVVTPICTYCIYRIQKTEGRFEE